MLNPVSTYRIQFHKQFNFEQFRGLLTYFEQLGIVSIYASPVFKSVSGSQHGYDILDPLMINPEIGSEEDLQEIAQVLQGKNMNWIQDIVPNHMAFDTGNIWLMDVLEKGPQSPYATFFDDAWSSPLFKGKLMVPFLGDTLEKVISKKELKVTYQNNRFGFLYYSSFYPLQPLSYKNIFSFSNDTLPQALEQWMDQLPKMEDSDAYAERWEEVRMQLTALQKVESIRNFVQQQLEKVNDDETALARIAEDQSYRLCFWQETDHTINYRRFFTVNGLICLNMQEETVFNGYHQKIKMLVDKGVFKGLRVDHIDGLFDPSMYIDRLRKIAGEDLYIVAEKILEPGEGLPDFWQLQGSTGYDFLALVSNVMTQKNHESAFTQLYDDLVDNYKWIYQHIHDKKSLILSEHMQGELENLYSLFLSSEIVEKKAFATIRKEELKEAIAEFLIQCPVYRFYGNKMPLEGLEAAGIETIFQNIIKTNDHLKQAVTILMDGFLNKPKEGNEERNQRALYLYQRCMQFTGPLMAKGVEDTLFYSYNRFIAHNEVGDAPQVFGIDVSTFHSAMVARQKQWPYTMNTTATHDTKRGEDVRARLNVLSNIPEEWSQAVQEWETIFSSNVIQPNDRYFIYQNILGAMPMSGKPDDEFPERLKKYVEKSLREAKVNSSWTEPNGTYESAAKDLVSAFLQTDQPNWNTFDRIFKAVADHGIINSLVQVLLKFTCPGVPDTYQGTELWDLSLVDPDNRRPVDYELRKKWLEEIRQMEGTNDFASLWQDRTSGKIKLWLIHQLLTLRKNFQDLFSHGEYIPLKVEGKYKDHVLAYARRYRKTIILVVVPLHTAAICKEQKRESPLEINWADTTIQLSETVTNEWHSLLQGQKYDFQKQMAVTDLFSGHPFAILAGQMAANKRGAGLLLHITSLPSSFGIGDLGPEARSFADFLHRHHQRYWQLLPLNPTEEGQGHSPYSSISTRAGNTLLISPELLVKDGLLDIEDVKRNLLPQEGSTNYREAQRVKDIIFDKAWDNFKAGHGAFLKKDFEEFKQKQAAWLDDYSVYLVLKKGAQGKPWYQWEAKYRNRNKKALQSISEKELDVIEKIKWLQFIFFRQWHALKTYCNRLDIELIGDLPFYVSYDSADVWSNRSLFAIDKEGNTLGMAGVPPDAFSEDGQLWGMPVYNWESLKKSGYEWWIERLKSNIDLFDLLRLDHFRAFSAYWEVPAGETTAKNGAWKPGPGAEFFDTIKEKLGDLPFIAEDLGDIDEPVYQLRDKFNFPGMKVLQFAFDESMPFSPHIPHNYSHNFIVYTGTHDNNTTKGWYRQEGQKNKSRIEQYLARSISEQDICWQLGVLAHASVARMAILPVQDILDLDEAARMNKPSSSNDNWGWRLTPGQLKEESARRLDEWTLIYNRQ